MQKSKIEWVKNNDGTQGYTWNPITGCLHGCDYCYARKIANRFQGDFKPKFYPERLNDPLRLKKPSTIFVGSMADMFGAWVKREWIQAVLNITRACPQHTFLFLTKKPSRYCEFTFMDNCWLGYTHTSDYSFVNFCDIENKKQYFLSAEPLLGKIEIANTESLIVIGALNQNGKPVPSEKGGTRKEWVLALLDEADRHKIPVFIKDSLYELYPDLPKLRELAWKK